MNALFVIEIENMNMAPRMFIRGTRDPNFLVKEYGDETLLLRADSHLKLIQWQMLKKNIGASVFNSSDELWLNGFRYNIALGVTPLQNRSDVTNFRYSKQKENTSVNPYYPKRKFNIDIAGSTKIRLVFIPTDPDKYAIKQFCQEVLLMNLKSLDRFIELHNLRIQGDISIEQYEESMVNEMEFTEKFNYNL